GAHTTYAAWRLQPQPDPPEHALALRVTLLANNRDHHGTTSVGSFAPEITVEGERLLITESGFFSLAIRAPGGDDATHARLVSRCRSSDRGRARPRVRRQSPASARSRCRS